MKLPVLFKILNIVGALLFGLFAWVQANDIDPEVYYRSSSLDAALWLCFYGLIAVLCALALFKPSGSSRWPLSPASSNSGEPAGVSGSTSLETNGSP